MTARIHFVRHAETLFNVNGMLQGWCDAPLTPRGEGQVVALGEWMRQVPLAAAFMSDLTRTRTTMAGALVGHPHLVPTPLRDLREWNFGSWEGQPNASLWGPVFAEFGTSFEPGKFVEITADGFDDLIDAIHRSDPLGRADSALDVRTRVDAALTTVLAAADQAARENTGDVLVVTHGSVLGSILHALSPESRPRAGFPNCGIVSVTWHEGRGIAGAIDASCA